MEIEISEPMAEQLFIRAAREESPVEEIVAKAIKNYMERDEDNAG